MRLLFIAMSLLVLSACTPLSSLRLPASEQDLRGRLISPQELARKPVPPTRVRPGDVLRIVRDAQDGAVDVRSLVEDSQSQLYPVRQDGSFSYRYAGRVEAAGKTPDEVAQSLRVKLEPIYREPGVTVNIASSPSNKVVIGGAVRNPGAIDANAVATWEQGLFAVGGLLPSADPRTIALLRLDEQDRYQVYFVDMAGLLSPHQEGRATVSFQRGDILFVPNSAAGNAAAGVDLYINQLLPFTRSLGVDFVKPIE